MKSRGTGADARGWICVRTAHTDHELLLVLAPASDEATSPWSGSVSVPLSLLHAPGSSATPPPSSPSSSPRPAESVSTPKPSSSAPLRVAPPISPCAAKAMRTALSSAPWRWAAACGPTRGNRGPLSSADGTVLAARAARRLLERSRLMLTCSEAGSIAAAPAPLPEPRTTTALPGLMGAASRGYEESRCRVEEN